MEQSTKWGRCGVRVAVVVLLAGAALGAGCTSRQPGYQGRAETTTNRVTGEVTTLVTTDLQSAMRAARTTVDEMQFSVENEAQDAFTGVVSARMADNNTINMRLRRRSDDITEVVVDAGPLRTGVAQTVMDRLQQRLGQGGRTTSRNWDQNRNMDQDRDMDRQRNWDRDQDRRDWDDSRPAGSGRRDYP